ncbi:hypothetical protein BGZ60DRAFT_564398 [Tricladium varicosporioides]|nr:hypothetical protein BGZ60DRAFT_564398 [Hymenoscyphus varicosporioides]
MSHGDSDEEEGKKRKHVTAYTRIEEILEKYGRAPTINELRAIKELPLQVERNLFDTSPIGVRIFNLLKKSEDTRDVSLLEEAGRLLWSQTIQPLALDKNGHVLRTDLFGNAYNRYYPAHPGLAQHIPNRGTYQGSCSQWSAQALPDPHTRSVAYNSGINLFHEPAPMEVFQQTRVQLPSGEQIVSGPRGEALTTSSRHRFTTTIACNHPLPMQLSSSSGNTRSTLNTSFTSNTSFSQSSKENQSLPLCPSTMGQQQNISILQAPSSQLRFSSSQALDSTDS